MLYCISFLPVHLSANTPDRLDSYVDLVELENQQLLHELDAVSVNRGIDFDLAVEIEDAGMRAAMPVVINAASSNEEDQLLSESDQSSLSFDELDEYETIVAHHHKHFRPQGNLRAATPESMVAGGVGARAIVSNPRSLTAGNNSAKFIGLSGLHVEIAQISECSYHSIAEIYFSIKQGYVRRKSPDVNKPAPYSYSSLSSINAFSDSRIASHAILKSIHQQFSINSALLLEACAGCECKASLILNRDAGSNYSRCSYSGYTLREKQ